MKNLFRTALSAVAFTAVVNAGAIVDVKIGTGSYVGVEPAGSIGNGTTSVTLDGTLALDSADQTSTYIEFEHLIPIVPNVKYEMNTLSFTGTASQTFAIGGVDVFTATSPSTFSWDHQDALFYWGIPFSTWIPMIDAADFGFGIKLGDMSMGVTGVSETTFDFGAVYGYARLHVSPPMLFGLGFEVEMKKMDYGTDTAAIVFNESIYKVDWMMEAPIPLIDIALGLEAGYKSMDYQLAAGGATFDLQFDGIFFNVVGKFGI